MSDDLKDTVDASSASTENVVENQDAENQEAAGQQNSEDQKNAPDSSTDADGKEPASKEEEWDPLKVVKKAIGDEQESDKEGTGEDQGKQEDDSSKSEGDSQEKDKSESEELGEITQEELDSYKPKTRKRIEALLDDRQRLTDENELLKPAAEQMDTLQEFMKERNLSPQNVSELMVVGGLAMSSDPKDLRTALDRVNEFKSQLETQLGEVLPEDLQKKVDEGLMDAASAKEVALSRVDKQRADARAAAAEDSAKNTQETATADQQAQAAELVQTTIADWQRGKVASDPDYQHKAELLQKEIAYRVQQAGGRVLDKQKALEIAEEAYAEVNKVYKSLTPKAAPAAKRVVKSKAGSGNMASTPNSPLDAAKAGLARAHA